MNATIIDFAVYENGREFLGIANITPPTKTYKTTTISGAGLGGDVSVPVIGSVDAMTMTINFIDSPESAAKLATPVVHKLDIRSAHEDFDKVTGQLAVTSQRYEVEVFPTSVGGGTVAPYSAQGKSNTYSVLSCKEWSGNKLISHVDVVRGIDAGYDGINRMDDVNKALGRR